MIPSFLKKQRKQRDKLAEPASPASFYSPNLERTSNDDPPPIPPLPSIPTPKTSPPSFPHGTRYPWPPPQMPHASPAPKSPAASMSQSRPPALKLAMSTTTSTAHTNLPSTVVNSRGSPEIQLDLGVKSDSLFDGFSGIFNRSHSANASVRTGSLAPPGHSGAPGAQPLRPAEPLNVGKPTPPTPTLTSSGASSTTMPKTPSGKDVAPVSSPEPASGSGAGTNSIAAVTSGTRPRAGWARTDGLAPLKIPASSKALPILVQSKDQSQDVSVTPIYLPIRAPSPTSPHAPSPSSGGSRDSSFTFASRLSRADADAVPNPRDILDTETETDEYSDTDSAWSYASVPDLDWGLSPGVSYDGSIGFPIRNGRQERRRRTSTGSVATMTTGGLGRLARNSHRLTRQDSATLPFDPMREAFFASLDRGSAGRRSRRNSERRVSRRTSDIGNSRRGSRHSRKSGPASAGVNMSFGGGGGSGPGSATASRPGSSAGAGTGASFSAAGVSAGGSTKVGTSGTRLAPRRRSTKRRSPGMQGSDAPPIPTGSKGTRGSGEKVNGAGVPGNVKGDLSPLPTAQDGKRSPPSSRVLVDEAGSLSVPSADAVVELTLEDAMAESSGNRGMGGTGSESGEMKKHGNVEGDRDEDELIRVSVSVDEGQGLNGIVERLKEQRYPSRTTPNTNAKANAVVGLDVKAKPTPARAQTPPGTAPAAAGGTPSSSRSTPATTTKTTTTATTAHHTISPRLLPPNANTAAPIPIQRLGLGRSRSAQAALGAGGDNDSSASAGASQFEERDGDVSGEGGAGVGTGTGIAPTTTSSGPATVRPLPPSPYREDPNPHPPFQDRAPGSGAVPLRPLPPSPTRAQFPPSIITEYVTASTELSSPSPPSYSAFPQVPDTHHAHQLHLQRELGHGHGPSSMLPINDSSASISDAAPAPTLVNPQRRSFSSPEILSSSSSRQTDDSTLAASFSSIPIPGRGHVGMSGDRSGSGDANPNPNADANASSSHGGQNPQGSQSQSAHAGVRSASPAGSRGPFMGAAVGGVTSPGVRSASPAGGNNKFMHPPRPPLTYSSWKNKSAGDVSQTQSHSQTQTQTQTPTSTSTVRVDMAGPVTPSSGYSSTSSYSAASVMVASTAPAASASASSMSTGGHGAGVRRMSANQMSESRGTSPAPSYQETSSASAGSTTSLVRGALPIGNGNISRTAVAVVGRLQQRDRCDSEPRRTTTTTTTSPLSSKDTGSTEQPTPPTALLHRKVMTTGDSPAAFPETPHEFSPILSPISNYHPSGPSSPTTVLSVPPRRMMPSAPMIEPAPPPKRRSRPPLPIGPRKPSVRMGGAPPAGANASSLGAVAVGLVHSTSSSSSSSVSLVTTSTGGNVPTAGGAGLPPSNATGASTGLTGNSGGNGNMSAKATTTPSSSSYTPPSPKFQTRPVRWRGLTMDAAKWTLTSGQLQDIVGRAIRQSAEASSIRLLTLDVLDKEIPDEIRRLEVVRDEIKSKYRASVRRRRMLFRSVTLYAEGGDTQTRARLSQELYEVSIACDTLTEELFRVMDELQQLNRLRDVHAASALAMALRKLNSSFLKQSADAQEAAQYVAQLEAERDEAWATAERVEHDLVDLQAKMDVLTSGTNGGTLTHSSASSRSSRVSAARKTSIRASKASLRLSRGTRSSQSSMSSQRLSAFAPPVPPVPRFPYSSSQPRQLTLNTDLPSASVNSPYSSYTRGLSSAFTGTSPTPEARALVEAQNELCDMLGITPAELRRTRSGRSHGHGHQRPASALSPSSLPSTPFFPQREASPLVRAVSDIVVMPGTALRRRNSSSAHLPSADPMYVDFLEA